MVELQIINKILQDRSLLLIKQNSLNSNYFQNYEQEFNFIIEHYEKYKKVPDETTFLDNFPEFDILRIDENDSYLVNKIKENYLFKELVPVVKETAKLAEINSNDAVNYLRGKIESLSTLTHSGIVAYDIVKNAQERLNDFLEREKNKGLIGITTGIKELDDILYGWVADDNSVIIARTNQGKTWLLFFFMMSAFRSGKRVLIYSGEMSELMVGYRFDTLYGNFSNTGMLTGNLENKKENYVNYLDDLQKQDGFIVVTPAMLGGKRLDIPLLKELIEKYKPDIVGVDQLSLMGDYRQTRNDSLRHVQKNISEDLYLVAQEYGIPVISVAQANREVLKGKESTIPGLGNIAEADAIGQNSTRVISMMQTDDAVKLKIVKNRYGRVGDEIILIWDIDNGFIKPALLISNTEEGQKMAENIGEKGVDLF